MAKLKLQLFLGSQFQNCARNFMLMESFSFYLFMFSNYVYVSALGCGNVSVDVSEDQKLGVFSLEL